MEKFKLNILNLLQYFKVLNPKVGNRSSFINIIILLMTLSALSLNIKYLKNVILYHPSISGYENILLYEKRFAGIKKALPSNTTIGYISDKQESNNMSYFLTQFALNPIIVTNKIKNDLFVGDFQDKNYRKICVENNYEIIKDFSAGVVLLRDINE